MLRAWRRLESWSSAGVLAAIAELARRRPADKTPPAPPGQFPAQVSEFASDEVAAALTLTGPAAAVMSEVALDLAVRLPGTFQAQHAGLIDYPRARLIAEVDPHPDQRASAPGGGEDPARGRRPDHRPAAGGPGPGGDRRRPRGGDPAPGGGPEGSRGCAAGKRTPAPPPWPATALPPADVLAADQRLTDRALALRAAGLPGSLEELRARAYLDALLGQRLHTTRRTPSVTRLAPAGPSPASRPAPEIRPRPAPSRPIPRSAPGWPHGSTLTLPLAHRSSAWPAAPGQVAGFGPVDAGAGPSIWAPGLASAHPRPRRCCITLTDIGWSRCWPRLHSLAVRRT